MKKVIIGILLFAIIYALGVWHGWNLYGAFN